MNQCLVVWPLVMVIGGQHSAPYEEVHVPELFVLEWIAVVILVK